MQANTQILRVCRQCNFWKEPKFDTLVSQGSCPWLNSSICTPELCQGISPGGLCVEKLRNGENFCFLPEKNVYVMHNDFIHNIYYPFILRFGYIIIIALELILLTTFTLIVIIPEIFHVVKTVKSLLGNGFSYDIIRTIFSLRNQTIFILTLASLINTILLIFILPGFTIVQFQIFGFIVKIGMVYYCAGILIIQWIHVLQQSSDSDQVRLSIPNT